jgi:N-acetylated-alpha-linked acidic dipeptidase
MTMLLLSISLLLLFNPASCSFNENEQVFLSAPQAESARQNLRFITSLPHVAGTDGDAITADFVQQKFVAAGISNVTQFHLNVLLNYPQSPPHVSLLVSSARNNTRFVQANLSEDVLEMDDTSDVIWRNHTFHGYSPSGTVSGAPLVYANYGRPQDFEALRKAGVRVQGCVVIVRYGKCFRGLKVMNAQERGALAVIIYSDPANDGFQQGTVYPNGPWRPSFGVQRGSVQFNSKCAGDPLRADSRYGEKTVNDICGVSSYTELIPSIPSVPMSYGDAIQFLKLLGGKSAKEVGGDDFCGGLDIEYTVGPSKDSFINLKVDNRKEIRSIPNVVAVIPGTLALEEEQDMPILLGNHRDAWVYGAADPNSGTASLIEVANGLGALLKTGWKPKRTIMLLSWSGEEYGLLGSTGFAELNQDIIKRAAAYLNVDTVVSGDILSVALTPSLATVWEMVLDDLNASDKHKTSFANAPLGEIVDGNTNWIMNHPEERMLGSGSDYTVFLDHYGISSVDFSFGKKTTYGQYHSIYDSFAWMDTYGGSDGKPGSSFDLMAFASKIWGLLALRLADSDLIPFDHEVQGKALTQYAKSIAELQIKLDLSKLQEAIKDYRKAAFDLHSNCEKNATDASTCNEKLGLAERQFLAKEGLPRRPWFKHVLQAPGMYLGYAAEAFPGIQQAIEMNDADLAQAQVELAATQVEAAASFLSVADGVTTMKM